MLRRTVSNGSMWKQGDGACVLVIGGEEVALTPASEQMKIRSEIKTEGSCMLIARNRTKFLCSSYRPQQLRKCR